MTLPAAIDPMLLRIFEGEVDESVHEVPDHVLRDIDLAIDSGRAQRQVKPGFHRAGRVENDPDVVTDARIDDVERVDASADETGLLGPPCLGPGDRDPERDESQESSFDGLIPRMHDFSSSICGPRTQFVVRPAGFDRP